MGDYTVKCNKGCEHCGQGKTWVVVDPDGDFVGTTYLDKDDALELADMLNTALSRGRKETKVDATEKEGRER